VSDVDAAEGWKCKRCHGPCHEPGAELLAMMDSMNAELRKRRGERLITVQEVLMCTPCYRIHRLSPRTSGVL
jgi:hypothetical protein